MATQAPTSGGWSDLAMGITNRPCSALRGNATPSEPRVLTGARRLCPRRPQSILDPRTAKAVQGLVGPAFVPGPAVGAAAADGTSRVAKKCRISGGFHW